MVNRRPIVAAAAAQFRLITAPTSLGLRPPAPGVEPGTWRAPEVLLKAGLEGALGNPDVTALSKPAYHEEGEDGTRIRNGRAIREYMFAIAEAVGDALCIGSFPVVIGGDCTVVLGALIAQRRAGGKGLVHVDGHSDFFHPGNYDTTSRLGAAAGMDLALATGRGEKLLTEWGDVDGPLVAEEDVIQVGEREAVLPDYAFHDMDGTRISRIMIEDILLAGVGDTADRVDAHLAERGLEKAWLHVDLDVLDMKFMPAVDCPGSPGLDFDQLASLVSGLAESDRIIGADFTIYDPDRDPDGTYAGSIVDVIARGLAPIARKASSGTVRLRSEPPGGPASR